MPVIPTGIPAYQIRPPFVAASDKCGEPSSDILIDTRRIFDLIEDERHLTAHKLLVSVQKRIKEWNIEHQQHEQQQQQQQDTKNKGALMILPAGLSRHLAKLTTTSSSHNHPQYLSGNNSNSMDDNSSVCLSIINDHQPQQHLYTAAQEILQNRQEQITKLENRSRLFKRARSSLKNHDDDIWTLGSTLFGISTFYHREDDHSLSIKLQGEVKDVPLFEQVCVLREVDLHYTWAPFCSSSMTVAEFDKLDVVGWFLIGLQKFGLARDGCFRVVGCDHTLEDGSFILTGHGIQDAHNAASPSSSSASRLPLSKHGNSSSNISDKKDKKISSDKEPKHGSSNISDKKDKKISSDKEPNHGSSNISDKKDSSDKDLKHGSSSISDKKNTQNSSDNEPKHGKSNDKKETKKNSSENDNNNHDDINDSSSSSDEKHNSDDYDFLSQDELLKQLPIPPVPTRRGAGRMTIRRFDAMITVTSPTSASIIVIANIDPNISGFHNVLLEFVMKHLAGVVLFQLQGAAKKAVKNPVANEHAKRMRAEEAFYKHWLLPKFQAICLEKGWEMPPVAAFELTPRELRKEKNNTRNHQQQRQQHLQQKKGPLAVVTIEPDHEQKQHAAATTSTRRAVTFNEGCAMDVNDDTDNDENIDGQLPNNHNPRQPKGFITRRRTKSFDLSMRQAEEENSNHHQRHHHDQDLISELSSRSGHNTPWPQLQHALAKGGPVGRFIRQQEIKQVRKQEDKVEQARQKISNMLKPKELDEQQMKRLQQLKLAKARRLAEEQGIYDFSSASFLLSPLQRSDSAPSLTELAAMHSDLELPKRATTTSGMAMSSLAVPTATTSSRLPLGLDETGTISTAATNTLQALHVPSLQHPLKQERRQQQANQRRAAPSIVYVPKQQHRRSFLRFVTDRLYTHGRTKKVLVVSLMVALLFVSLHPHLLLLRMKPPKFLETYNETADQLQQRQWWESAACLCLDAATTLYLSACAILHFFLCDISLVYAFDSLELGYKTGRQVRKSYIDNVRLPVAMTSFGIVALSVIKALSRLGLRAVLWFLLVSCNAATSWSSTLVKTMQDLGAKVLPSVVGDYRNMAVPLWARTCLLVQETMRVCLAIPLNFVLQHAVRSNRLGRSAEAQLLLLLHEASTSARGAIDAFEGKIEVAPWRMEAFETARTMFAYTAVFLVTALILFSLSAGQKRRAAKTVRIDSRVFKDDSGIRTGIKEDSSHPPPVAVSSSPATATTTSLKEDVIRKKDDDDKNNIARLESSLQSFGLSQHDAESVDSPESSHSNSSSSDNKARGVLRFRKKWTDPLHESFPLVLGGKVRRRKTTL